MFKVVLDCCEHATLDIAEIAKEVAARKAKDAKEEKGKKDDKAKKKEELTPANPAKSVIRQALVIPMTTIIPEEKETVEIVSDKIDKKKNFNEYIKARLNEVLGDIF